MKPPDETPFCIAVVDDDPRHVEAICRILAQQLPAAEVRTASDGVEGLALVSELRPHLLLLDYVMPGQNGAEVCRAVRARPELASTRILVISGHVNEALEGELGAAGADLVLPKSARPGVIIAAVRELLSGVEAPEEARVTMKAIAELEALRRGMAARGEQASLEALRRFLEQLTHDLNNPLGTFGLELFTARDLCDRMAGALDAGDTTEMARQIETLGAVCANLEGAGETARRLLEAIDERNVREEG
jgi:DNA-binding NarL/FixJ family response regulator